jgi:hypothetical protein
MSPNISIKLRNDIYRSGKSTLIGVILWLFVTFAPEPIYRSSQVLFESFALIIDQINNTIGLAEMMFDGDTTCYNIKFRTFGPETMDLDALYQLQELLNVPEIYCNPDIQAILNKMSLMPPLRLMLDLLNIPTVEQDIQESCKGIKIDSKTFVDAVLDTIKPVVTKKYPVPEGCPAYDEEDVI